MISLFSVILIAWFLSLFVSVYCWFVHDFMLMKLMVIWLLVSWSLSFGFWFHCSCFIISWSSAVWFYGSKIFVKIGNIVWMSLLSWSDGCLVSWFHVDLQYGLMVSWFDCPFFPGLMVAFFHGFMLICSMVPLFHGLTVPSFLAWWLLGFMVSCWSAEWSGF